MAPPEVPLRATTWYHSSPSNLFSAPAVNAVWLPPPWQAIAIRLVSFSPSTANLPLSSFFNKIRPCPTGTGDPTAKQPARDGAQDASGV